MWKKIKAHPWWVALAVVALALVVFLAWRQWGAKPAAPAVITAEVVRGDIDDSVLASGTIQASKLINVGAQVSGQVNKLFVKLGDVVKEGQLIAEIDATTQENNLKDAQAALASSKAQKIAKQAALGQAQAQFERQKYMFERDATSKADYQSAQQALATAKADLAAADASIAQYTVRAQTAQANVGYTRITAPMAGTVVAVVTDAGQTMNANQTAPTIVKLAVLDPMTIQSQISEADVPRVKPGMPAYFTILGEPDTQYQATLRSIEPGPIDMNTYDGKATSSNSNNAVYYNGLLDAPNPGGKLRIQMTAQVSIVLDSVKNVLIIPSGALHDRQARGRRGAASGAKGAASDAADAPGDSTASAASAPRGGASGPRRQQAEDGGRRVSYYTVTVATGKKGEQVMEERKVKIGMNNRVQAEVLEGLKEGEQVVVGSASADGATGSGRRGMRMF